MIQASASHALFVLAVLAAVLTVCLYLFFSTRADLRRTERRFDERLARLAAKTEESELRFNVLETQATDLAGVVSALPVNATVSAGPTQGKRTMILNMARRGEESERIAAAVGMECNEVDLVVKVHRAVAGVGR